MHIGIIGTGKMGSRLGRLWVDRGHAICFGSREPQKAYDLAEKMGANTRGGDMQYAAAFGDVVVIAVPWNVALETVKALPLNGKIVIDITNAVVPGMAAALGNETSGAEEIAKAVPGAKVIKAFNGIHFPVLENPYYGEQVPTVFYCGDDVEAKKAVHQLIVDVNLDPVDAGPLTSARYVEAMAAFWIYLSFQQGMGADFNFKMIRR